MLNKTLNRRINQAAVAAAKSCGAALVASFGLIPCSAVAEGPTPEEPIVIEEQVEDSVLVATREALEESYTPPEGALEPISQESEHEPSPADPPNEHSPPSEAAPDADSAAVEVTDQPTLRVASRASVSSQGDVANALLEEDPKIAAAPFKGIIAGKSSKQELLSLWGSPSETRKVSGGEVYSYNQDRFALIEVKISNEQVELIRAQLDHQSQPDRLAAKLRVDSFDSVTIQDEETGEDLGVAYPEKGLTLLLSTPKKGVTPIAPQFVTHIALQAPDAEAFALRAQTRPEHAYSKRLADLDQALTVKADDAYSLWLRSGVYLATGQPVKAEADAVLALEQDEQNGAYRLRWCEALAGVGRVDDAVIETRKVIDTEENSQLVKAQALALMGRLASLGDSQIAEKAIGFHTTAISVADKLATSSDDFERRAAKRLLIESHLAVAVEVSRRSYNDKADVVAQWIGRASGLAEEYITNEQGSVQLRLVVARTALEALANLKPSKDPGPWVTEASEAASEIVANNSDILQKHQAHWELGQALFHALRVAHTRREADRAIGYGEKALDHLAEGAETGDVRPEAEQLVGRLYFHLGAAHAVHKQDHVSAVDWYERALPLLTSDRPESELVVPRQLGEALVSMGVSYWDQEQQAKAMELTVQGAEIMEQGVEAGVLDPGAMAVPYGNLATMHRKRGESDLSSKYSDRAAKARDSRDNTPKALAKQPGSRTQQRSANSTTGNRTARRTQSQPQEARQRMQRQPATQPQQRSTPKRTQRKGLYSNRKTIMR